MEEDERKTVSSSEEEEEPSPRATSPSLLEAKRGRDGVPHKTLERLQVLAAEDAGQGGSAAMVASQKVCEQQLDGAGAEGGDEPVVERREKGDSGVIVLLRLWP